MERKMCIVKFATIFAILNVIPRCLEKNNNELWGVTHKKFDRYRITDACADNVISQPIPKHYPHYQ